MPSLSDVPGVGKIQQYVERGAAELHYVRKIFEAGAFRIEPPQNYAAMASGIVKWGEFGMLPALNAARSPDRAACIDEDGEFSFKELDETAHAVANGLLEMGVKGGDGVAILARNTRWFLIAYFGAARVGARIILLNSEFSGPQVKEVSEREGAKVIIYDDEYSKVVSKANPELGKLRALGTNPDSDEDSGSQDETLADLIERSSKDPAPKASKHASIIILTSGTTGTPKGANRSTPPALARSAASCRMCRSRPTRSPRCRRRCSTRWASCTPPSRCSWARRWCCAVSSSRRWCSKTSRSTRRPPWLWCR